MNILFALLAGCIQGLTEFLPISSTAHLIIFQKLFNLPQNDFGLAFDASIHLGTLLAVILFFYKDYLKALSLKNQLFLKLIVGTVPAVIFGILLENYIETSFRSLFIIGASLICFSFVMLFAEYKGKANKSEKGVSLFNSLIIGFAQSIALIPGISRSGSTISAGLFLGLSRAESARFAFMLSGPIIAGAGLKKFIEVSTQNNANYDIGVFIAGIISSFVFGYLTIKYFLKYLQTNNLTPFIVYRLIIGVLLILISAFA